MGLSEAQMAPLRVFQFADSISSRIDGLLRPYVAVNEEENGGGYGFLGGSSQPARPPNQPQRMGYSAPSPQLRPSHLSRSQGFPANSPSPHPDANHAATSQPNRMGCSAPIPQLRPAKLSQAPPQRLSRYQRERQRNIRRAEQIEEHGQPQAVACTQCAKRGLVCKKDDGVSILCGYCVRRKCACEPGVGGGGNLAGMGGQEEERDRDRGAEESENETVVGYEQAEVGNGNRESLADELESDAVSSVCNAGSNASAVHEGAKTSGDEEESGSEFSDEERYQAWEEEMEMERRRRGW